MNGEVSHEVLLIIGSQSAVAVYFIIGHRNDRYGEAVSESYAVGETTVTLFGCCHNLYLLSD